MWKSLIIRTLAPREASFGADGSRGADAPEGADAFEADGSFGAEMSSTAAELNLGLIISVKKDDAMLMLFTISIFPFLC
jgi:hypothetical protein